MKSHVGGLDFGTIESRDFILEDLVFWFEALTFHAREGASTRQNHFSLRFVLYWTYPSGVAIDVVEQHLILVAAAGTGWKLACLVCVDCGFGLVNCDKNIKLL